MCVQCTLPQLLLFACCHVRRAAYCRMLKILAIFTILPSVSHGFVAPLTTSGGSAPVHKASAGADMEPANWALIFDCDGVILEVRRAVFSGIFSPDCVIWCSRTLLGCYCRTWYLSALPTCTTSLLRCGCALKRFLISGRLLFCVASFSGSVSSFCSWTSTRFQ